MMRALLLGTLALALALPGAALADGSQETLGARASVRAAWVDAGEFGSSLGVGVDLTMGAASQWLVGIEWTDGGLPESRLWPGGTEEEVATNLWGLSATWLTPRRTPEQVWQLGLGAGVYLADSWQLDNTCLAPHVLVRAGGERGVFAEARYVALTDFGSDLDTDGLRLSLGYRF